MKTLLSETMKKTLPELGDSAKHKDPFVQATFTNGTENFYVLDGSPRDGDFLFTAWGGGDVHTLSLSQLERDGFTRETISMVPTLSQVDDHYSPKQDHWGEDEDDATISFPASVHSNAEILMRLLKNLEGPASVSFQLHQGNCIGLTYQLPSHDEDIENELSHTLKSLIFTFGVADITITQDNGAQVHSGFLLGGNTWKGLSEEEIRDYLLPRQGVFPGPHEYRSFPSAPVKLGCTGSIARVS